MFDVAAAIFGRCLRYFGHILINVDDLDISQEAVRINDVSGKGGSSRYCRSRIESGKWLVTTYQVLMLCLTYLAVVVAGLAAVSLPLRQIGWILDFAVWCLLVFPPRHQ